MLNLLQTLGLDFLFALFFLQGRELCPDSDPLSLHALSVQSPALGFFLFAVAVVVDPTALVAKDLLTPALHLVAPHRPLDPVRALWALFKLLTLSELHKFDVLVAHHMISLVLLAGEARVVLDLACEAVVGLTERTLKLLL